MATKTKKKPALPPKQKRITPGYCKATKKDGTKCTARRHPGFLLCYYHQFPDKAAAARKRSVESRAAPKFTMADVKLNTPADVMKFIESVIRRTIEGELSPSFGARIGKMAEGYIKAMEFANAVDPGFMKKTDRELIQDWARILLKNGDAELIKFAVECLKGKHGTAEGLPGQLPGTAPQVS